MKRFLPLLLIACLCGCYSKTQAALETELGKQVESGKPIKETVAKVESMHFKCVDGDEFIDCTRVQGEESPYFCVPRIKLYSHGDTVSSVQVSHILCYGP
jgi:hypothetical protein